MTNRNINTTLRPQMSAKTSLWVLIALGAIILLSVFGFHTAERYFLVQSAQQSQSTLRLAVAGLRGALRRFEPLPALIAEKPSIKLLLSKSSEPELTDAVNLELKRIAQDVGASDVYVIDGSGNTVAASNFDQPHSFMGRSYAYRPYFQQAREGGLGRFFALGTASLKRGYYFAAPVTFFDKIVGVVTVKLAVDSFESDWQGNDSELLVTDTFGITFMSSRPEWHFKTLNALDTEAIAQIETSRQYPLNQLGLLNLERQPIGDDGAELFKISKPQQTETFVANAVEVPEVGWTFHVLAPTKNAYQQTYIAITIAVLLLLSISAIVAFLLQRRARLFDRIEAQRNAQELLERRVQERTADLNEANTQLKQEVEERKLAERQLRKTQTDLVQAGKLAALGQMSAALSHEFNQPLTAVKTYADNAATYLDRDRPTDARENVSRISQMADRMAAISRHLRNFARRPQEKLGPVPVWAVIDDALEILSGKLRSTDAKIILQDDR
ncbi:MAG: histidine kinase dimerization/phospho-acceptor domain-containing protein, partial [Hyphomicrobiales bacterium]